MKRERQIGSVLFLLVLFIGMTGVLQAVEVERNMDSSVSILMNKKGQEKRFVKISTDTLTTSAKSAAKRAKSQSGALEHAGEVYYIDGTVTPSNRYITTGHIVVRFTKNIKINLDKFASKHALRLEKSMGRGQVIAVFVNISAEDDITVSNTLVKERDVSFVEPDWILPLKLY